MFKTDVVTNEDSFEGAMKRHFMRSTYSISNTLSKVNVDEEISLETISNERIQKGDVVLEIYQVTSDAIRGGMGSVWRVHHMNWDTDLAMKRPQPKFFAEGSEKRKESFIRECEAWINLGLHPNIVSCYYVREIGGVPSIFSEWMENGSLKNRIDDGSLYEGTNAEVQERLLDIAIQFARGLHYAHESEGHLIHQDVKPDNLLLSGDWDAKVADFGLARARMQMRDTGTDDSSEDVSLSAGATHLALTGGYTPGYCSAEQLTGEPLTRRTDIYSWGVSILEMYIGRRPWERGTEAGENCGKWFDTCRVAMPEKLKSLLKQCLNRDPGQRPHDFMIVLGSLYEIYREQTSVPYSRPDFQNVIESAESLNNKALSFLDLKKYEEAENCWKRALENNSTHIETIFNELLYRWNKAEIDDIEVLKKMRRADNGSAAAMMCQLKIQIARADSNAQRCMDILINDRSDSLDSSDQKELARLAEQCSLLCREDEFLCKAPEGLLIADEKGNLGCCISEGERDILVFRDSEGNVTEQYEGNVRIKEALFDPSYQKIAVVDYSSDYKSYTEKVSIYDRGSGEVQTGLLTRVFNGGWKIVRKDEANETVREWLRDIKCGLEQGTVVSYVSGNGSGARAFSRLNSTHEETLFDTAGKRYSKYDKGIGSGDVRYILKPKAQIIKTLMMPSNNKMDAALNLNADLYLDYTGENVFKRCIPDPDHLPKMVVSRVHSYEESVKNDREFSDIMELADRKLQQGDANDAVNLIDKAMNVTGHFTDRYALDMRRRIMEEYSGSVFDRILTLYDYQAGEDDIWYLISEADSESVIQAVLDLNMARWIKPPDRPKLDHTFFSYCHRVIPTQKPGVFIVTAFAVHGYDHPRYGDDMYGSSSWVVVIDMQEKRILYMDKNSSRFKYKPYEPLGTAGGLGQANHIYENFINNRRIAAALSNDGSGMIVSCKEKTLLSNTLSVPENYKGPQLDYIFPTITDNYYLFFGNNYAALVYMTKEEGTIIWEDYTAYSELIGFNREKSIFSVQTDDGPVSREVLWNFEKPSVKSRIVIWENPDYFGPKYKRSSYF